MMALEDGAAADQQPLKAHSGLLSSTRNCQLSFPRGLRGQRQRAATFVAFVGVGLASWLMTNATYVELGVYLRELPEHYSIYAYSILALESANLYPMLYMALNAQQQIVSQAAVMWWILGQGLVVAVLMSVLWAQTASVFGSEHSAAMLLLTHFGGMVSTTSSVVFYPYVANFPPLFTSALATGEALSGSVAALLGIIQDPGGPMRFSVTVFYLICSVIMCVSIAAFSFLRYHPWALAIKETGDTMENFQDQKINSELNEGADRLAEEDTLLTQCSCGSCPSISASSTVTIGSSISFQSSEKMPTSTSTVFRQVWSLLACQWILAAFSFGWLPSTMPYVYRKFAPANDVDAMTARFQTTASVTALILSPLASILTTWLRLYYVRTITLVLVMLASILLSFSLIPTPVLSNEKLGYLLPLLLHISFLVGYSYTQTMLYINLKRAGELERSTAFERCAYQWNGLAMQIGAMSGTAVAFPLVFWYEDLFIS